MTQESAVREQRETAAAGVSRASVERDTRQAGPCRAARMLLRASSLLVDGGRQLLLRLGPEAHVAVLAKSEARTVERRLVARVHEQVVDEAAELRADDYEQKLALRAMREL